MFQSDVNIDLLITLQIVVWSRRDSMEPPEEDWYVDCSDDEKYSYPGAEKGMTIEHSHFYFLLKYLVAKHPVVLSDTHSNCRILHQTRKVLTTF